MFSRRFQGERGDPVSRTPAAFFVNNHRDRAEVETGSEGKVLYPGRGGLETVHFFPFFLSLRWEAWKVQYGKRRKIFFSKNNSYVTARVSACEYVCDPSDSVYSCYSGCRTPGSLEWQLESV